MKITKNSVEKSSYKHLKVFFWIFDAAQNEVSLKFLEGWKKSKFLNTFYDDLT